MGVEYRCYLISRPNLFRPSPAASLALVNALRHGGWLLGLNGPALEKLPFSHSLLYEPAKGHGYFALTVGNREPFAEPLPQLFDNFANRDLKVVWPVESLGVSGLHYPLEPLPFEDPADAADCYYQVEFHFGRDFIYHMSEIIHPFEPAPTCAGGHPLEFWPDPDIYDPFYSARLAACCPKCGSAFDPTNLVAPGRDGWTGANLRIQGGATYRFALVIDCGKCFGQHFGRLHHFHPRLKALVEQVLDIETYEVSDFN